MAGPSTRPIPTRHAVPATPEDETDVTEAIDAGFGSDGDLDPWSLLEEFASVIGHELRTPLAVVKSAAETGIAHGDRLGPDGVQRLLETIARNSDLALLLVDRIGLARDIEEGTVGLARELLDLSVLVAESVNDLGHVVLRDHPIEVTGADSLVVSGDPTALREIVFNLLANAAKYSAADAAIEVAVRQDGDRAEVVIRNHGTGVTPGDIHVQPADQHGSEFILTLPV